MKTLIPFLAAVCCFAGCAHQARTLTAPNSTRLVSAGQRLSAAVAKSKAQAALVSTGLKTTKASLEEEAGLVALIEPQIAELAKRAPLELVPYIKTIDDDFQKLKATQTESRSWLDQSAQAQGVLTGNLEEATAAKNEVERLTPEYFAEVEKITTRANVAEAAWAKDSAEIVKLRTGSILFKIAAGIGLIALTGLAFLWFTGRIATAGATIASRL